MRCDAGDPVNISPSVHFIEQLPMEYAVELNRLIQLRWKARSAATIRPIWHRT
jgi:hypothetical protein